MSGKPWKEDNETQGIELWSEAEGRGRDNLHIIQYGSEEAHMVAIYGMMQASSICSVLTTGTQ